MNSSSTLSKNSFLQKAILGNAIFSIISGAVFVVFSGSIADFLGDIPQLYITIVGIVLLLYAPFLYVTANRKEVNKWLVWAIIELDALWVLGSLVLIFTNLVPLSTGGKWSIAIIADTVAVFGILQFVGLRKALKE